MAVTVCRLGEPLEIDAPLAIDRVDEDFDEFWRVGYSGPASHSAADVLVARRESRKFNDERVHKS